MFIEFRRTSPNYAELNRPAELTIGASRLGTLGFFNRIAQQVFIFTANEDLARRVVSN